MEKEFNLSEKSETLYFHRYYKQKYVKEFIKIVEEENDDFGKDIISLIEINNYGKDDLIIKMKRLIKAHRNERDKIAGSKLK